MRRRILASMKGKKPSEIVGPADGEEPITAIVDSSGLSTTNKGSYIEDRWKKEKRKYVKLHLVADRKTGKIVGFRVTSEKTGDNKKSVPLVKEVSKKRNVAKAYADTMYDARKNFDVLHGAGIEPAIKLRKNASTKSHGSPLRREEVLLVKRLGYERWKELKGYGKRWLVEIVFSSFKRVLRETLRSRRFLSQKAEASLKVMLYNRFMSIRP
jgi:transposase